MIKTNIKPFPENWDEVTFAQAIELTDFPSKSESIRRILGIQKGVQVEGIESLYRSALFLEKPFELEPEPKKLGDYDIPQDITLETAEQFEDISSEMRSLLNADLKAKTEALAFYVAVYLQPKWFATKYDSEQARHLSKILLSYPCTEVMSAGAFFQAKFLSLESGLPMSYLLRSIPLKRKKPASTSYLRHLGLTRLWTILRVTLGQMMRRFLKRGQSKDITKS